MRAVAHVTSVVDILDLIEIRSATRGVVVRARGRVPTLAWTAPTLIARAYVAPPEDGMQEFDFLAVPPQDVVIAQPGEIEAQGAARLIPGWAMGVRVVAATDELEYRFPVAERAGDRPGGGDDDVTLWTEDGHAAVPILPEDWHEEGPEGRTEGAAVRSFELAETFVSEARTGSDVLRVADRSDPDAAVTLIRVPTAYRRTSRLSLIADIPVADNVATDIDIGRGVARMRDKADVLGVVADGDLATGAGCLDAELRDWPAAGFVDGNLSFHSSLLEGHRT